MDSEDPSEREDDFRPVAWASLVMFVSGVLLGVGILLSLILVYVRFMVDHTGLTLEQLILPALTVSVLFYLAWFANLLLCLTVPARYRLDAIKTLAAHIAALAFSGIAILGKVMQMDLLTQLAWPVTLALPFLGANCYLRFLRRIRSRLMPYRSTKSISVVAGYIRAMGFAYLAIVFNRIFNLEIIAVIGYASLILGSLVVYEHMLNLWYHLVVDIRADWKRRHQDSE